MALWVGVGLDLEGTVDDASTLVLEEGDNGLVHGSVPREVSGGSPSVSVASAVVEMVGWLLVVFPLLGQAVGWGESWHSGVEQEPVKVWIVTEVLHVVLIGVSKDWSSVSSVNTSEDKPSKGEVHNDTSGVESLDWQFSQNQKSKKSSELSSVSSVLLVVKVRSENWSWKE